MIHVMSEYQSTNRRHIANGTRKLRRAHARKLRKPSPFELSLEFPRLPQYLIKVKTIERARRRSFVCSFESTVGLNCTYNIRMYIFECMYNKSTDLRQVWIVTQLLLDGHLLGRGERE